MFTSLFYYGRIKKYKTILKNNSIKVVLLFLNSIIHPGYCSYINNFRTSNHKTYTFCKKSMKFEVSFVLNLSQ